MRKHGKRYKNLAAAFDAEKMYDPVEATTLVKKNATAEDPWALAWTKNIMHDNGVEACGHVMRIARGEIPDSVVNREVLDRPGFRKKLERYR